MPLRIKSRLWLEFNDEIVLGEGRLHLLQAIEKHGSINLACKSLGMSYKKAWRLVEKMNATGEKAFVERKTGGTGGGGTTITEYGRQMMDTFISMRKNVWQYMENEELQFNNTTK